MQSTFVWKDGKLCHFDRFGELVAALTMEDARSYYDALPATDRQEPFPQYPVAEVAADVASDPAVQRAASDKPDAGYAAVIAAAARAEAAFHACESARNEVHAIAHSLGMKLDQGIFSE